MQTCVWNLKGPYLIMSYIVKRLAILLRYTLQKQQTQGCWLKSNNPWKSWTIMNSFSFCLIIGNGNLYFLFSRFSFLFVLPIDLVVTLFPSIWGLMGNPHSCFLHHNVSGEHYMHVYITSSHHPIHYAFMIIIPTSFSFL